MTDPRRYWPLLLLLASLWGASYLFIEIGLRDMSPAMVVFGRTLVAGLILLPLVLHRHAFAGLRPLLPVVVLLAAMQVAGPFMLISTGQEEISSSLAGILVATAPIWTALLAMRVDHDERSSGWRGIGVAVGIVGVAVLLGVDVGGSGAELVGGLLVVLASLGYALGGFLIKRRLLSIEPIGLVTATMLVSAALTLPVALATAPSSVPGLGPIAAVVTLGALGTGAAFVIYYSLIGVVGPARTALVAYIAPGFAVVYGVTLLGESFTVWTAAGLALILAGSWLGAEGARLPGRAPRHAATGRLFEGGRMSELSVPE